ncbi:MAG: efflux RND transporter periplasmic adaptor subunit [Anaerolineales bacterium]|nr:efflux RND transporter periplasmic adaptor subunit [Anaerolineales bacterium]
MKRTFWIMLLASAFVLAMAGCSPASTATPIPSVSLDVADTSTPGQVKASAVVVPTQESRLSFVISGLVEDITVAEGDQVQAGQALVKLDTSELEYDVISAEAALTSAEIDAKTQRQREKKFNFQTFKFVHVSPPAEKILAADSRVEQSRFALEVAKASLAQGTLLAPFDGTIVEVNISPGEYVQPAQVVIVLVNLENLQIETTDLSELDVAAVKIGQPATVYVEALNEEFPGQVTAISPVSNTIGGDVVFKVTIQLDEQPKALLWGMSADIEINVE